MLPEAKLDDLDVDSLMLAEIMFEFEDRFNLTLRRNLKSPRTVGELVARRARRRSQQGCPADPAARRGDRPWSGQPLWW